MIIANIKNQIAKIQIKYQIFDIEYVYLTRLREILPWRKSRDEGRYFRFRLAGASSKRVGRSVSLRFPERKLVGVSFFEI